MKPRISVLLPTYNTKVEYIKEAIDSILEQTYEDFELLILDDGSDEYLQKFILTYNDNRIRYFYKNNTGIADTLNFGLALAKGEYVARMDADDISLPNRFKEQLQFLDEHQDVSVVGSWIENFQLRTGVTRFPYNPTCKDFLKGCVISHPSMMIRIKDFNKLNLKYDPSYSCEDYELWSRAVRNLKFINIPKVLLKYRINSDSITYNRQEILLKDSDRLRVNLIDYMKTKNLDTSIDIEKVKKDFDYKKRFKLNVLNHTIKLTYLKHDISVVELKGDLAEQMTRYAYGKHLEQQYHINVMYDCQNYNDYKLYQLGIEPDFISHKNALKFEKSLFYKIKHLFSHNSYLGYYRNVDLDFVKPSDVFNLPELLDSNHLIYKNIIKLTKNSVFVDATDFYKNQSKFESLLNKFRKELYKPIFYVFNYGHNHIYNKDCVHVNVEANSYVALNLMSCCKHGIMSNTDFSRWCGTLINNKHKILEVA